MAAVFSDDPEVADRDRRRGRRPRVVGERPAVVQTQRIDGALVVIPEGVLDFPVLQAVDRAVAAAPDLPVLIELSACALTDASVLEHLNGRRWAGAEVRVVCPRRSARQLLARAGVPSFVPVFGSLEEAIT